MTKTIRTKNTDILFCFLNFFDFSEIQNKTYENKLFFCFGFCPTEKTNDQRHSNSSSTRDSII